MPLSEILVRFKDRAQENALLWATISTLIILAGYMEKIATPAKRPFSLQDSTISYPFTESERYPENWLFILCIIGPLLVTSSLIFTDEIKGKFHRFYKTTTCLTFSIALTGFLTAFLKIRFAKLRPDFLARCGVDMEKVAMSGTSVLLHEEIVCSAPYGANILADGYKSCPSGHSSISTCGMLFVSLWLFHTYGKHNKNRLVKLICFTPVLLSLDIITSRIYDFRHGYIDILLGTVIGATCTILSVSYLDLSNVAESEDIILPL